MDEIKKNNDEINETEEEKVEQKKKKPSRKTKIAKLEEDILELKAQVKDWENKYYTAYADTQNLRKQYDQEQKDIRKYRAIGFIDKLLPALDSFQIVLSQEVSDPVIKNYLIGFEYIYRQLIEALTSEGVSVTTPKVGDEFDANTMNAMEVKVTDEVKPQTITKVYTNGYKLHERLIRPAQVEVAVEQEVKNVEAEETIDEDHLN